ncbi:serine hydrolase domain-containing protein [Actinomadura viridis]|uniref:D-alanyl-D-alanine carboxypeptidase n=1 Tax=Actinomadura viridis TaxID=58110 RepID=A0A931DM73_9ACTN|nr:serine hydrolase domain-containing protein [Actinomadura viridis]MBG6093779.1 D-alanyl-D-alanine carboxypeptidase [Actinomadura viridis]
MRVSNVGGRVLLSTAAAMSVGLAPAAHAATATAGPDLQRSLDAVVAAGAVGVQAETVDERGVWRGTSGTARLGGSRPVPRQGRFRIGSTTKTFTATVLLQLVAERRLGLDDPVERHLPGLVPNGEHITVRQVLNHTSGLREYLEDSDAYPIRGQEFLDKVRFTGFSPERIVRGAARKEPYFPPGGGWHYSNTNYLLAGLVIEKVTGRPYGEEVRRRIIVPLGLGNTSVPGGRTSVPGPHAHGYMRVGGRAVDITRLDPSWAGAAGEMISTTGDLNRFFGALLGGRLLPPAQLAAMQTTVATGSPDGSADGLGLMRMPLSCGVTVWGKDGGIHGFTTQSLHSSDGRRHISISVNEADFFGEEYPQVIAAVQKAATAAFCGPE